MEELRTRELRYEFEASLEAQGEARDQKNGARDPSVGALKILAIALLKQIESLETRDADRSICKFNLKRQVQEFEREIIRAALIETGGRQRKAAKLLGMKVTTLNTKIRRYAIKAADTSAIESQNHQP